MIVIDNWYKDPDKIRSLALKKFTTENKISGNSIKNKNGYDMYPGFRVLADLFNLIENKDKLEEQLNGLKINPSKWIFTKSCDWEDYINCLEFDFENLSMKVKGTDLIFNNFLSLANGNFQYCPEDSKYWIHSDVNNTHAAIVYLNHNPISGSGTGFFKHLKTEKYYDDGILFPLEESNNFNNWEMIDYVENKFNRCVIFDSKQYHSATKYFGTTPENSRLIQVFFFDIIKT